MPFGPLTSEDAERYATARPTYPDRLFADLVALVDRRDLAWDCATGGGQAARGLAEHFQAVIGVDVDREQVAHAYRHDRIGYLVGRAEFAPLRDHSVDLATVAVALHWLEQERFYREVKRVVRPGGVLACWNYYLPKVNADVDEIVRTLCDSALGPEWLQEVRDAEKGYHSLPFPFSEELAFAPSGPIVHRWNVEQFVDYLRTWGAWMAYRRDHVKEPFDAIRDELVTAWGGSTHVRDVTWDLQMRVGRVGRGGETGI